MNTLIILTVINAVLSYLNYYFGNLFISGFAACTSFVLLLRVLGFHIK